MTHHEACTVASLLDLLFDEATAETQQIGPDRWCVVIYDEERALMRIYQAERE